MSMARPGWSWPVLAVCVGSSDLSIAVTAADPQQLIEMVSTRIQTIEGVYATDPVHGRRRPLQPLHEAAGHRRPAPHQPAETVLAVVVTGSSSGNSTLIARSGQPFAPSTAFSNNCSST